MPAPFAPVAVGLALLGGVACAGGTEPPAASPATATAPAPLPPSAPSPQTTPDAPVMIETIDETTVGDLDGVRVPMGNMTTGTYTLPDGTEATGTICSLALPDQVGVFVGMDSIVDVEGTKWKVIAISKPEGQLGSVTLQKLDD